MTNNRWICHQDQKEVEVESIDNFWRYSISAAHDGILGFFHWRNIFYSVVYLLLIVQIDTRTRAFCKNRPGVCQMLV